MFSLIRSSVSAVQRLSASSGHNPFLLFQRLRNIAKREGLGGLFNRGLLWLYMSGFKPPLSVNWLQIYSYPVVADGNDYTPKVSVIVPCYNHAPYLPRRLDSIYTQTYSNFEVVLLDDCSTDCSRDILLSYQHRYPNITSTHFNNQNSGGVFRQWAKGFELANGDLIWVAESDDYCSANFLSELVSAFRNTAVKIAFSRTSFVSGHEERVIWRSEDYLHDLGLRIWNKRFIASAYSLTKNAWVAKNIIPNVSAAVFRHPRDLSLLSDPTWQSTRLCGDWIFYLAFARGGLVAYSPEATNYYRQHERNTSVTAQKEEIYYREHFLVREYINLFFSLSAADLDRQRNQLYRHWCVHNGLDKQVQFNALYSRSLLPQPIGQGLLLNIAITTYALVGGGGETLPLMLANLLHRRGHAVIVIDFHQLPIEAGVQAMLDPAVPLLKLDNPRLFPEILKDLAIDVVHSHHAWVDMAVAALLNNQNTIKHVVTMHGMYEMMSSELFGSLSHPLESVDYFVYTADKNLAPFSEAFLARKPFLRIDNAVTSLPAPPVSRSDLGIESNAFLLCMVARGIPDKGWQEAIDSVLLANQNSAIAIHLLLIGDGEEADRLKPQHSRNSTIHFLGFQSNIRAYYECSDMGFIPSRFKGESFPLVLIDCLTTGRPVLASAIGEIPRMLQTPQGDAGVVFDLNNWQIPIESLARLISDLANDGVRYKQLCRCVPYAASKFDPEQMASDYEKVYSKVCTQKGALETGT